MESTDKPIPAFAHDQAFADIVDRIKSLADTYQVAPGDVAALAKERAERGW